MEKFIRIALLVVSIGTLIIYLAVLTGAIDSKQLFDYLAPIFYVLIIIATMATVVFLMKEWFAPKALRGTLYALTFLLVIFIVSYFIANDNISEKIEASAQTVRIVGMGIWAFVLLSIAAVGAIFWSEIRKFIS